MIQRFHDKMKSWYLKVPWTLVACIFCYVLDINSCFKYYVADAKSHKKIIKADYVVFEHFYPSEEATYAKLKAKILKYAQSTEPRENEEDVFPSSHPTSSTSINDFNSKKQLDLYGLESMILFQKILDQKTKLSKHKQTDDIVQAESIFLLQKVFQLKLELNETKAKCNSSFVSNLYRTISDFDQLPFQEPSILSPSCDGCYPSCSLLDKASNVSSLFMIDEVREQVKPLIVVNSNQLLTNMSDSDTKKLDKDDIVLRNKEMMDTLNKELVYEKLKNEKLWMQINEKNHIIKAYSDTSIKCTNNQDCIDNERKKECITNFEFIEPTIPSPHSPHYIIWQPFIITLLCLLVISGSVHILSQNSQLKKRMNEADDLKLQVKSLENQNSYYLAHINNLENISNFHPTNNKVNEQSDLNVATPLILETTPKLVTTPSLRSILMDATSAMAYTPRPKPRPPSPTSNPSTQTRASGGSFSDLFQESGMDMGNNPLRITNEVDGFTEVIRELTPPSRFSMLYPAETRSPGNRNTAGQENRSQVRESNLDKRVMVLVIILVMIIVVVIEGCSFLDNVNSKVKMVKTICFSPMLLL